MGGLRKYMPITCVLMWIATLAIAGIPPFAGFFSKDEILGAVFARAQRFDARRRDAGSGFRAAWCSTSCTCSGSPRRFMTAVYMTRMMLYTFHGPNRTGEAERKHLHEAPWIMTGPLVVLGVLSRRSAAGSTCRQSHRSLGPVGVLDHWLEPVVGECDAARSRAAQRRKPRTARRPRLIGVAVVIAVARYRGRAARGSSRRRWFPRRSRQRSTASRRCSPTSTTSTRSTTTRSCSPSYRTVARTPLARHRRRADRRTRSSTESRGASRAVVGWLGSQFQSGQLGTYAWVLVVGVLAVLGAFTFR